MKSGPLRHARIDWPDGAPPRSIDFGDRYHPRVGAAVQARHVFLAGNGLPQRWSGRTDFTIAETGFGLGNNFVACWQAWRDDPQRPTRLHYVAVEAHPPALADLARAHAGSDASELARQLLQRWPPAVPGLHGLDFEGGALRLWLAFGDVGAWLPELVFRADAFFLDGFAPACNPDMWSRPVIQALARHARPDATCATWSVARGVRDGLAAAGFDCAIVPGIGGKRDVLRGRFAPRFASRDPVGDASGGAREAIVVGAGLAGACTAAALAARGFDVRVLDRHAEPAAGSSGNPAGLFHATVHADDGPYARLFRAAALRTAGLLRGLDRQLVPHSVDGLLRLERVLDLGSMQDLLQRQGLPADFVQALDAGAASLLAGTDLATPAWFYPAGGWVAPAAWVRTLLSAARVRFSARSKVATLRRDGALWRCLDDDGTELAAAPHVVLANAEQADGLLGALGWPALPLRRSRGQVSRFVPEPGPSAPRLPLSGDGYAVALPDGSVLCGATSGEDDGDRVPRDADHRANVGRLGRLCGVRAPAAPDALSGRVGCRLLAPDRLPLVGALPARSFGPGTRLEQLRLVPREPGLHLSIGFGGRGITLAPLLGELLAAQLAGTPWPVERRLAECVDPARWIVRAARRQRG